MNAYTMFMEVEGREGIVYRLSVRKLRFPNEGQVIGLRIDEIGSR